MSDNSSPQSSPSESSDQVETVSASAGRTSVLRSVVRRVLCEPWPPIVQWAALVVAALVLFAVVDSTAVESPYNGF